VATISSPSNDYMLLITKIAVSLVVKDTAD